MDLRLIGGTNSQRELVGDAVSGCDFPFASFPRLVSVKWVDEPPCPGHAEFACTKTASAASGGGSVISIRRTLDTASPPLGGEAFYKETVIHELMHAVWFASVAQPEQACRFFEHSEDGHIATASDYNPLSKLWEERVQEAIAETLKDQFFPGRSFNNRTNWRIRAGMTDDLLALIGFVTGGAVDYDSGDLYPPASFVEINSDGNFAESNGGSVLLTATRKLPSDIPAGASFGWIPGTLSVDFTCGQLVGSQHAFAIECPAGHAPPGGSPNFWTAGGPTGYPNDGSLNTGLLRDLEDQGFAPVGGTWVDGFDLLVWVPNPARDYYVYIYDSRVGVVAPCMVEITGILTPPQVVAAKHGPGTIDLRPPSIVYPPKLASPPGTVRMRSSFGGDVGRAAGARAIGTESERIQITAGQRASPDDPSKPYRREASLGSGVRRLN